MTPENGRISSYLHSDGITSNKAGSLVKVSCQTDFAARTLPFRDFCDKVARLACGFDTASWDELVTQFPGIEEERQDVELQLKEKITVVSILLLKLGN